MLHFWKDMEKNGNKKYRISGREDRISLLPDPILKKILMNLPTKDVVKTSLLSTRWRSLWLSVPYLDLDDNEFSGYDSFVNFVDRFVKFSAESPIEKLKLNSKRETSTRKLQHPFAIQSWVDAVLTRNIKHLEINFSRRCIGFEVMPIRLFVCQTLVCLRLRYVAFRELDHVSLPHLKTMHLEEVRFTNKETMERLIASCHVLEDLSIVISQDYLKVIRVYSQTINSLNLVRDDTVINRWDNDKLEVVIDAPRLKYLSLKDNKSASFTINSLCSSTKVDIAVDFNVKGVLNPNDSGKRSSICNFLNKISRIRDMTICWNTLKVICQYSKMGPIPYFCFMSQLHAKIFAADLQMLPNLLERCLNLKSLILELNGSTKIITEISFSYVPLCLQSSLESFEMKTPIGEIYGVEMNLIKYFLENSTVLKKLTLHLGCAKKKEKFIFVELLRFRRYSTSCEVNVVGLEETLIKL